MDEMAGQGDFLDGTYALNVGPETTVTLIWIAKQ